MTIDEFLEKLATVKADWKQGGGDFSIMRDTLRCTMANGRWCCPITAMGQERSTYAYQRDAREMGLTPLDAETIAIAADGLTGHADYSASLRERLLDATVRRPQIGTV